MKITHVRLSNNQFDDQYTFELYGLLSQQVFEVAMRQFNQVVQDHPPPGNKLVWLGTLWTTWVVAAVASYVLWLQVEAPFMLLILPSWIIFESAVLEACTHMNATENSRGINYRFCKNGSDVKDASTSATYPFSHKATYAIAIEFDARYDGLESLRYSKEFVSVPLCPPAHLASHDIAEKDPAFLYSTNVWQDAQSYEKIPTKE